MLPRFFASFHFALNDIEVFRSALNDNNNRGYQKNLSFKVLSASSISTASGAAR